MVPRSAISKAANALGDGAGERAFFVSEKFAFEQGFRDGGAIDFDERAGGARAPGVNDIGHHFLAHAAFAGDENAAFGSGDEGNIAKEGLHQAGWRQ